MRRRGRERASEEGGGRVFRTSPHPCAWPTWSLHVFLRNWAQQCRGVHERSVPVRMRISVFWASLSLDIQLCLHSILSQGVKDVYFILQAMVFLPWRQTGFVVGI